MTTSSWTFRKILLSAAVFFVCALPASALAAVRIVDVMYDPPGADQGHEWIQLANAGAEPVNLAGYRLYEGGINHKITVMAGTSTLAAGAVAIIAVDPAQYEADYPAFAGALFKSSFSLSNTGETIALKDSKLAIVDTYRYTAPVVVKEPPVKKTRSAAKAPAAQSATLSYAAGDTQTAASLPPAQASLPALPSGWLYGLGFAALLLLAAAAVLYARPTHTTNAETLSGVDEFNIE